MDYKHIAYLNTPCKDIDDLIMADTDMAYLHVHYLDITWLQTHLDVPCSDMIILGTPALNIAYLDMADANISYVSIMYLNLVLYSQYIRL